MKHARRDSRDLRTNNFSGIIQAITNQQTGLNVITELIIGYMQPGRPVAMMLFKSWGYMMAYNGLNYVSDMKIGHYMKSEWNPSTRQLLHHVRFAMS